MIAISEVSFAYAEAPVLADVSARGSVLAVTGANGAGKTTLLKLILGLLSPSSGTVSAPASKAAVFQEDRLIEHLTAIGNVRVTHPGKVSDEAIAAEFQALGLAEDAWRRRVRDLSGGQRRRVCLARALLPKAELVCLDEPFKGIDADSLPAVRAHVLERLRGGDVAIATHDAADLTAFQGVRIRLS
ncbi:MAG: ATP-binding cassette domain-containing protein [Bifidobacteriaceae bacterium]|nr:ATP-binding cassette domain-containing protein [Bifidobacteriaceae bacterium]